MSTIDVPGFWTVNIRGLDDMYDFKETQCVALRGGHLFRRLVTKEFLRSSHSSMSFLYMGAAAGERVKENCPHFLHKRSSFQFYSAYRHADDPSIPRCASRTRVKTAAPALVFGHYAQGRLCHMGLPLDSAHPTGLKYRRRSNWLPNREH